MVMAQQKPIQVMIVDDHPMVRDGIKVFLSVSPGMECSGEASSGEEEGHYDAVRYSHAIN